MAFDPQPFFLRRSEKRTGDEVIVVYGLVKTNSAKVATNVSSQALHLRIDSSKANPFLQDILPQDIIVECGLPILQAQG